MISVILNVYRRPENLKKQIDAILAQTVKIKPENIHIWYNYTDKLQNYPDIPGIKTYTCNWNTKFWGRFILPGICRTKFIALFDDDIIPKKDWFKNCMDSFNKKPGLYGGSGILLKNNGKYRPHTKVGWNGEHNAEITEVDLVGHAWFFPQEYAQFLLREAPSTWENGEDIMFAYLAQKYGDVHSYVPPHPENRPEWWSSDFKTGAKLGSDNNASWRKEGHYSERDAIVAYCIDKGWKTIKGGLSSND